MRLKTAMRDMREAEWKKGQKVGVGMAAPTEARKQASKLRGRNENTAGRQVESYTATLGSWIDR